MGKNAGINCGELCIILKMASYLKILGLIVLGFFVGFLVFGKTGDITDLNDNCPPDLKFIKPEDDCESFADAAARMQKLQDDLRKQVNVYLNSKRAERISIFGRDLNSQRFIIVNETEQFYMASLLKVPLAIAYYRLAEITPDLLEQKVVYTGSPNLYSEQEIQPPEKLEVGKTYTIRNLIRRALAYSDNTAAELLAENYVSYDYLQKILFTLGLQPKAVDQKENIVTARSYASVFRTLYNSSFLSREHSNEILEYLFEDTFDLGATAGLPDGVKVAHKFGERSLVSPTTKKVVLRELHDCGVVYPEHGLGDYSFCIMTEGQNFSDLESIIQNISKTIYEEIGK